MPNRVQLRFSQFLNISEACRERQAIIGAPPWQQNFGEEITEYCHYPCHIIADTLRKHIDNVVGKAHSASRGEGRRVPSLKCHWPMPPAPVHFSTRVLEENKQIIHGKHGGVSFRLDEIWDRLNQLRRRFLDMRYTVLQNAALDTAPAAREENQLSSARQDWKLAIHELWVSLRERIGESASRWTTRPH